MKIKRLLCTLFVAGRVLISVRKKTSKEGRHNIVIQMLYSDGVFGVVTLAEECSDTLKGQKLVQKVCQVFCRAWLKRKQQRSLLPWEQRSPAPWSDFLVVMASLGDQRSPRSRRRGQKPILFSNLSQTEKQHQSAGFPRNMRCQPGCKGPLDFQG